MLKMTLDKAEGFILLVPCRFPHLLGTKCLCIRQAPDGVQSSYDQLKTRLSDQKSKRNKYINPVQEMAKTVSKCPVQRAEMTPFQFDKLENSKHHRQD